MDALYRQSAELNVRTAGHYGVQLALAGRGIDKVHEFAGPLWLLMGSAGFVLLIACCNLGSLLLGRAASRAHEMGVRLALGAGRMRLVRQLLTESLLLSAAGAVLAAVLAWRGAPMLLLLAKGSVQVPLSFGGGAALFTAAIAIAATLLFGVAPALTATRVDVHTALRGGRRTQSAGRSRHRIGRALVMAQIAISVLLLSGAGLLVRSLWNLRHQDFGFRSERVLTVNLPIEFNKAVMERNKRVRDPLYARLNSLPGVRSAALAAFGPMSPMQHTGGLATPQRPVRASDYIRLVHISPGYFGSMGIRMVAGRPITGDDREHSPKVAVLSETGARTLFGGGDAVGQIVSTGLTYDAAHTLRIVGVAHDVRFSPRDANDFLVYVPLTQEPAPVTEAVLRTAGAPAAMASAVRAAIHDVDANLPIGEIRPLDDIVDANLAHEQSVAVVSAGFGVVALALTCIGVYGVVAYAVKRRTQEIGIRLALGAGGRQVARMLMTEMAAPVLASLAPGAAAAMALGPVIRSQLFGIAPHDYSTLLLASAFIALVAAVAAYLPARRAARLDPLAALREE